MKRIILTLSVAVILVLQSCNESETNAQSKNGASSYLTAGLTGGGDKITDASGTIKLSTEEFKQKVFNYVASPNEWKFEGDLPCIVDFYADWCAPCRMTAPIMEELASENSGKIRIYKVDVQKEQEIATVFGIQSIPSFLFCPKEGDPMMTSGIARTPEETKKLFQEQINTYLLK
ncbi:MAG: thiol reductase thioredoxin [Bacteroidales bacterium]|nr:thiol reductase thioredoxin [Bacteroidales bacterium]